MTRRKPRATETRLVEVQLTDVANGGDAVGRVDNQVVFVSFGIPGERVVAEIYDSKKDYLKGNVTEVLTRSPDRVQPVCEHFTVCGGCQWQHVDYPAQLELKRKIVENQLRRIGGFVDPPVKAPLPVEKPWNYRNHARFSLGKAGRLGFRRAGSHWFLPVDNCALMHPYINDILASLQGKLTGRFHQIAVRYGISTGSLLIQPAVDVPGLPFQTGQAYFEEALLGRRFRISGASFFQVNTGQAERMATLTIDSLGLTGSDVVVDAYSGVGTFGLLMAERVRRVIAIEDSGPALKDAAVNAANAGNVELVKGAAERVLPNLDGPVDCVVLDPPRAGCRLEVIESMKRLQPRRIAYVSCDPATLARDLRQMCETDFHLSAVHPVDMFPQTYHIESVAIVDRL